MKNFFKNSSGATAIEYALIAGLIAIGAIVGMTALGNGSTGSINATFTTAADRMNGS